MDDWSLAALALFCLVALLMSLLALLVYSGLFSSIDVKTTKPPIGNVVIAYKDGTGPYQNCGSYFTESCSIDPTKTQIGLYYDDPEKVGHDISCFGISSLLLEGDDNIRP